MKLKTAAKEIKLNTNHNFEMFRTIPMEVAVYDINGNYIYANDNYLSTISSQHSIIGKDDNYYFKLRGISPEGIELRKENFTRALKEKKTINFTEKLHLPDKKKSLYYKRSFQPLFTDVEQQEVNAICLFGNDLTAVILGQKELKYLVYHDRLTGLKNRDAFGEQLDQILLEYERNGNATSVTAILYLDLDNFKLVNDTFGHDIGDRVLGEVASRLKICLRKSDYTYRLGGDEFTIIIKNMQNEWEIARIAEKISTYLSTPYFVANHKITYLTTSIGIVIAPRDGLDRENLLKNADTAMYNAKRRGKNNFQFFSQDMTLNSVKRLKIEKNLTKMVNKNDYNNQLKIYYQPIIERLETGEYKVIGSEALLRWMNPDIGSISPSVFIPIAEETNLIMDIGNWIFYRVCKDYKNIYETYPNSLYASINLSAKQLRSISAIKKLERILNKLDFDPKRLQLELTETSYLDDHMEVISNLKRLQDLGIRLALDDFGVGYASLSYLHKVPARTIKIDRSFIRFLSTSSNHNELVKSIIILGQNLNMDVIAEGVEQVEDLYLLNEHCCHKYQGHLFSMPLSLQEFIDFLNRKNLLTTLIH